MRRQRCKKKAYPTAVEAMLALGRIQSQRDIDNLDKHERCYYPCTKCTAYHITSWRYEDTA